MSNKRRRNNKRNRRNRNNKRRYQTQQKREFEIGAFICIRKQREGVGFVKKTGDKNSYLIAFKNGSFGWYRSTKINNISEEEYNNASDQFIIDKNLPSPSPTPSMSYSPQPNNAQNTVINNTVQIKFKEPIQPNTIIENKSSDDITESKMQITVETVTESEHKKPEITESEIECIEKIINSEIVSVENTDTNSGNIETIQSENNGIQSIENEPKMEKSATMQNNEIKSMEIIDENQDLTEETEMKSESANVKVLKKEKKKIKKEKKAKIAKVITPKISKFEKKMKLYYKVKDLRERSFLIMCDENRTIDLKSLCEYIEHFGKTKPNKSKVKQFLDFMKPNGYDLVSFSKFVKAIDDDGDVVAGFERFKKYGNARAKK